MKHRKAIFRLFAASALSFILSGCAGITPLKFGATIAEVEAAWGQPTQVHTLPTGARLLYSLAPLGHHVFVAEFDKQGRLARQYDAMDYPILARVRPGWKRWEVERELGPPFWFTRYRVSSNVSAVYRYEAPFERRCFYVEFDAQDAVVSTVSAPERSGRDLFPGEREC